MASGLSGTQLCDSTFIGRRGHACEARTWAAVAKAGIACKKLERGEDDPVGRMADDTERVSMVMRARQGQSLGMTGAHDAHWRRAYEQERRTSEVGWATRHGRAGCAACCSPPLPDAVCAKCDGWMIRGRRGRVRPEKPGCICRRPCETCGGGVGDGNGEDDAATGLDADGWADGARGVRRSGVVADGDGGTRSAGRAGLLRTTTERLVDTPRIDSGAPLADRLADPRHVIGGECAGCPDVEGVVGTIRGHLQDIERAVVSSGGALSDTRSTIARARAYLDGSAPDRARRDDEAFAAFRRVVACHIEPPDWIASHHATDADAEAALHALEQRIISPWLLLVRATSSLCAQWGATAANEVGRRRLMEESREWARLVLIAWRELADGARAGAASWDTRWHTQNPTAAHAHAALARRLTFSDAELAESDSTRLVYCLFTWMRYMRASITRRQRRKSSTWRHLEDQRKSQLAQRWPACEAHGWRDDYHHREEEELGSTSQVTSGAAAVLCKRRRTATQHNQAGAPTPSAASTAGSSMASSSSSSSPTAAAARNAAASSGTSAPHASDAAGTTSSVATDEPPSRPACEETLNPKPFLKPRVAGGPTRYSCSPRPHASASNSGWAAGTG